MPPPKADDFAALAERVAALHSRVGDLSETTSRNLVEHDGALEDLFERVAALESSICSCPDCVMHREKARHGKVAAEPELPAWQRAKVGDRVEFFVVHDGGKPERRIGCVSRISHDDDYRLFIKTSEQESWIVANESVVAILPPEPAATVQDVLAEIKKVVSDTDGPMWSALWKWLEWDGDEIRMNAAAAEADAAVAKAIDQAYEAGLLAGTPRPLSIDWNTALDAFHAASRPTYGTASDGVMAVLKLVPGLKVEG